MEEIIVASNEIAASTAQLVVASNVKADRESKNRKALMEAKTNVSNATAGLVASAKSCIQIFEEKSWSKILIWLYFKKYLFFI